MCPFLLADTSMWLDTIASIIVDFRTGPTQPSTKVASARVLITSQALLMACSALSSTPRPKQPGINFSAHQMTDKMGGTALVAQLAMSAPWAMNILRTLTISRWFQCRHIMGMGWYGPPPLLIKASSSTAPCLSRSSILSMSSGKMSSTTEQSNAAPSGERSQNSLKTRRRLEGRQTPW